MRFLTYAFARVGGYTEFILLALAVGQCLAAETIRLPAIKDNSIVLYPGEMHLNAGNQRQIRIKGNQHIVAIAFDMSPIRGRRVTRAALRCRQGAADIKGLTVSTIAADWDEYKSSALTSGMQKEAGWGVAGILFPAVCGGNSFTLVYQAQSILENGWYRWEIAPDLVHACATGLAYGLALHEHDCDYSRNPTIFAREEAASAPFLEVEVAGENEPPPPTPTHLTLYPAEDGATLRLRLRAPPTGLGYRVEVNGMPLPRWNIPFVKAGGEQIIFLRDMPLSAGAAVEIAVRVIGRSGVMSAPVKITGKMPVLPPLPTGHAPPLSTAGSQPPPGMVFLPQEDRLAANGRSLDQLPDDYTLRNEIWHNGAIRLKGAGGEVVGFLAMVKGQKPVKVQCRINGLRIDLYRALYVKTPAGRVPDPLLPLAQGEEIPLAESEYTPLAVDVFIPFTTPRQRFSGSFALSDGRRAEIIVEVRSFALPRCASFLCEMNTYGMPDAVADYARLQEIAYEHRCHVNILHYGHRTAAPGARKCVLDMRLATGRRMDEKRYNDIQPGATKAFWGDFAEAFGPFLTGDYFEEMHRGPVPLPGFYLTFHESWPLPVRAFFNGDPDAYRAFNAKPEYARTFVAILQDFIRTAAGAKWRAGFQIYLNNKGSLQEQDKAPWVLDEPASYWDYRALAYYADLVRQAKGDRCPINLRYRIDVSRPEFTRGELAGKADLWVVSTSAMKAYQRLVADRMEMEKMAVWLYGAASPAEESSRAIQAWVLECYRLGASGVVPWQTVVRDNRALSEGDPLALFILDAAGTGRALPSLRLKAFRRGQQDAEYLELLRQQLHLSRPQMALFMDALLPLAGGIRKADDADAGTAHYFSLCPESFRVLREAAAHILEAR